MSFLDRAKQTANKAINNNDNKGGSPMGNPFIKQNLTNNTVNTNSKPAINVPGAKPSIPSASKPVVPGAKPPVGGIKPPVAKPPIGKPPVAKPPVTPVTKEEVKPQEPVITETKEEEVIVETLVSPQEPVVAQEPAVEEPAVAQEPVKEETEKEEVKEETKEEVKSETPEFTEEELAAMSPQKRAAITRKKNAEAKKKAETKTNAKTAIKEHKEELAKTQESVVIPETELNFADCVTAIKSNFVDQEWEDFRNKITTTMSEIVISNEMNKPQLHDLLSQIAILRDEIAIVYNDTKTLYEGLTAKDDGLIDRTKRLNAKGTNAEERKVSGTIAVMNYKSKEGHNINLYELLDETRARYNFLKTINESIEFKKAVLLTMLSSLKSEK